MIDNDILKIIACPRCKNDLILDKNILTCAKCGKEYKIKGGIPILLE